MSINGRRVVGATHVRSGDLIRMSESGPEFSFRIVAGAKGVTGQITPRRKPAAFTGPGPSPKGRGKTVAGLGSIVADGMKPLSGPRSTRSGEGGGLSAGDDFGR